MIVSFSVSNFRSFNEEETLNLVASNHFPDHSNHLVPIPGSKECALRTAVIYGANGAGKTNLFKAMQFFVDLIIEPPSITKALSRQYFRFAENQSKPSTFDLQFITAGMLYRFGFKLDDHCINEEWLTRFEGNNEKVIYERITNEQGTVKVEAPGLTKQSEKLSALVTVGGPKKQTFLTTIKNTLDSNDYGEEIKRVLSWLEGNLFFIAPNSKFHNIGYYLNKKSEFLKFASEFLKSSSTGVDNLEINKKEISEEQLTQLLSESEITQLHEAIEKDGFASANLPFNMEIAAEKNDSNKYYLINIQASHEHETGIPISLEWSEESDGTKRLLNLIPTLHLLNRNGSVFFIDEIDRSMHPLLTIKFLEFFLSSCGVKDSQIIVTTHESNLLDLEILRRDEIWFAEKNNNGATKLYSLADFKIRTDLRIDKHYMQGRFGAVPFVGNLDLLLEKENKK
jgi:AAA15 family ATPase/GTPase